MYAELHCKTHFSFLEGASFPDELVDRAAELELAALAVTDRNSLAGVVKAHTAAKERNVKLLIGAEIRPTDAPPILLYATDRAAYGRLSQLITVGRRRAEKGECELTAADIAAHATGLIGVAVPPSTCDGNGGADAASRLALYRDAFAGRLFVAAEVHLGHDDAGKLAATKAFAAQLGARLVACNDVHYHNSPRRILQDVLVCTREGVSIHEAGTRLFPNAERRLKSAAEMRALFQRHAEVLLPESPDVLLERSLEIAGGCSFSLDELRYEYPHELTPPGVTLTDYLNQLTWDGAKKFWPHGIPEIVRKQLNHELALIAELHYEAYFLTVWDLVAFARARGILCQGRGSAANSAVCYALGITSVDPERSDVLFERFISRERAEAPDIDVDFEHERREEVMQYVYAKYGRDRAGIVAEVICYRPKSAVRDVGKALGLPLDRIDQVSAVLDPYESGEKIAARLAESGLDPNEPTTRTLIALSRELLGFPRHLSQHVGGFVITRGPLSELVPIENASMADRTVIEWDKDDIDALGILKVDCLALGMLTCIHRCFELVNSDVAKAEYVPNSVNFAPADSIHKTQIVPRPLALTDIPAEDPLVYEMSSRADTVGVFQIESRAQMSMLPRLKPRCFYDLVIEVSIVRPGPIQGGMVHPYLRRRNGEEPVTFPNETIRAVLQKTLGVPLFQEQVMRLAMVAAGFSPGEADQLRRAMGAWRRPGVIDRLREKMLHGMLANGYPASYAEQLFDQIRGFGEYGFPESHAASFALLVYASAWLKLYYPAAFLTALLNSQPMGFYAPAQLIRDAVNHGVTVHPVDVNHSQWDSSLEPGNAVRLGFRLVRGLSELKDVAPLLAARTTPFRTLEDFARRSGLSKAVLSRLAAADVFRSLQIDRRTALWSVLALEEELPLFRGIDVEEPAPSLEAMPLREHISEDYHATGLSLKSHPLALMRAGLSNVRVRTCAELAEIQANTFVRVAGVVLVRQRPETASGTVFMTIEDETGNANLICWPKVFERHRRVGRSAPAVIAEGRLQKEGLVINLIVSRLLDLSEMLPELENQSRDFR